MRNSAQAQPDRHVGEVSVRFYAQLNDFLRPDHRGRRFTHLLGGTTSVKDTIEALGVPHPEVDLVLVNGSAVDFAYRLRDRDIVSVYPPFHSIDLAGTRRVGINPPEPVQFVVDGHLGKLASFLRLAGFDTLVIDDDAAVANAAARDARVALTRDRGLLKRNAIQCGYWVRHTDTEAQLAEVFERFALASHAKPFTRCLRCNEPVRSVPKEEVADRVPPRSLALFQEFHVCPVCNRVYWRGSHHERLRQALERATRRV